MNQELLDLLKNEEFANTLANSESPQAAFAAAKEKIPTLEFEDFKQTMQGVLDQFQVQKEAMLTDEDVMAVAGGASADAPTSAITSAISVSVAASSAAAS